MKRFWRAARLVEGAAWGIELDGRPLKTPARTALAIPGEDFARAILAEWDSASAEFDPRDMPLTGLANAAIDRVAPDRAEFAAGLARYADADLLCYRAENPQALVDRQTARWDPQLEWARTRFAVEFTVTSGVLPVAQPYATVTRLSEAVAAFDDFALAGLSPLVTIGGSLVVALALVEDGISLETAWSAVSVDEEWQIEKWGADDEAVATLAGRARDFAAASKFLNLL